MVNIVGISAGRKNKVSDSLVKAILEGSGREHTFINLSGKLIRPCEACNGCVDTNRCVLKDDLMPILEKCYEAQAIVFGAPRHWNHMNTKGLAFWERACFSGRHNSVFLFPLGTPITESITPSIKNQHPEIPDIEPEQRNLLSIAGEIGATLDKVLEIKQKKGHGFYSKV